MRSVHASPRHPTALLASLAWALLLIFGASPVFASAEVVRLRFVFAAMDEQERAALMDGVARFERSHQGVVVEALPFHWAGYGFHDTLVRLLALEDPSVDVYRVDLPWIPELAAPGWLLPLDDYLAADGTAAFVPAALAGGRSGGQLYGLPLSLKGSLLFFRRDLLDAHGLTPPDSLAELGRQASLLRRERGLAAGLALHPLYLYNDVLPVLWASGGDVLGPGGEVVLDSAANQQALAKLATLFGDGPDAAVPVDRFLGAWAERYAAPFDDFAAGQAAFAITWSQRWHALRGSPAEGRVGVTAIPGLQPGPGSSNLGSWYLAVNRFGRHPDEAVAFVRFMTGEEAQRARLELNGEIPALTALLEDPGILGAHPEIEAMVPVLTRAGTRPRVADERSVGAILEGAFHAVLVEGASPARALGEAADRLRQAPLDPAAAPPPPPAQPMAPGVTVSWMWPLLVGCGGALAALLAVGLLLVARARLGLEVLVTLRAKLMVSSALVVVVLALTSSGITTSLSVRAQQHELAQHRAFFTERVREQASSQARNLGLALALLDEQQVGRDEEERRAALSQLLMASQFSEDLLFLELLGDDGALSLSDRDANFVEGGQAAGRCDPPETLGAMVASRTVQVYDHACTGGGGHAEVLVPLFRQGVHRGALRLGFSRARFEASLRQTEARHAATLRELSSAIAATGLVLLAVCLLGVALLARQLTQPVVSLTRSAARIRQGELDTRIEPSSRDELGTLATSMGEMVQGLRDRDFIRDAFGRYLTQELARKLVEDPGALELGGHERTVTILMSDLRGFSGLSERLGPEAMVGLLNRYLGAMTEVIVQHRGMINEFIGDAILVLFGALEAGPDDPDRALRCALDMQRALREFNLRSAAEGLPVLAMGIGVNTGNVVAGNIGSEQRVKYGVVGTPVNLAARLESLTIGSQVLVSADCLTRCRDAFLTRGPHEVGVKGSERPLRYHELLGIPGEPALDLDRVSLPLVSCAISVRIARLEGKRLPEARMATRSVRVGADRLELEPVAGLALLDAVVLELDIPGHGWSRALYAKVVDAGPDGVVLAITSVEPEPQAALRRLVEAG